METVQNINTMNTKVATKNNRNEMIKDFMIKRERKSELAIASRMLDTSKYCISNDMLLWVQFFCRALKIIRIRFEKQKKFFRGKECP